MFNCVDMAASAALESYRTGKFAYNIDLDPIIKRKDVTFVFKKDRTF